MVSDATPLNVLCRLRLVDHLPAIYARVFIPPAVRDELTHPWTPPAVRSWMGTSPSWLIVQPPSALDAGPLPGKGEREAIALAKELRADRLLADDAKARRTAELEGITPVGTLGLVEIMAAKNFCSLQDVLQRLPKDFWLDRPLIDAALERDRARQHASRAIEPEPS